MYYGYVQQSGMYETLGLMITEIPIDEFNNYYNNHEKWCLSVQTEDFKNLVGHLWFVFISHGDIDAITVYDTDRYYIDMNTIKKMFPERLLC